MVPERGGVVVSPAGTLGSTPGAVAAKGGGTQSSGVRSDSVREGLILRAVIASALLVLMIGGGFAVLLAAVDELRDAGRQATQAREELAAADSLEKLVIDLETGQRGFVITRKARFLQPWRAARA